MNASVAIQVLPMTDDTKKVLSIVDSAIKYIKSKNLKYEVSAFETTIEGDYDQLMDIVKNVNLVAAKAGAKSVMTYVKINYQPKGKILTIDHKVNKYKH